MSIQNLLRQSMTRRVVQGAVPYGGFKKDGSHDHRTNKGADRTPAQKRGDLKRTKPGA